VWCKGLYILTSQFYSRHCITRHFQKFRVNLIKFKHVALVVVKHLELLANYVSGQHFGRSIRDSNEPHSLAHEVIEFSTEFYSIAFVLVMLLEQINHSLFELGLRLKAFLRASFLSIYLYVNLW
jgi:hypothetical protein